MLARIDKRVGELADASGQHLIVERTAMTWEVPGVSLSEFFGCKTIIFSPVLLGA